MCFYAKKLMSNVCLKHMHKTHALEYTQNVCLKRIRKQDFLFEQSSSPDF